MHAETTGTLDILRIRKALGRDRWSAPQVFGLGWSLLASDRSGSIILTSAFWEDGHEWVHASIARDVMPSYDDLCLLHRAVWPGGWAVQVFAPPSAHVNIHPRALHLWGRADGVRVHPDFGAYGTI